MTLLDTNIIIDLLGASRTAEAKWSRQTYVRAMMAGSLACNHVIVAEVAAGAARPDELEADFDRLEIETLPLSQHAALAAGQAFATYRQQGGVRRSILADFLIAGHAAALGATLATRDRRLGSYFPDLDLITPETHP